MDKKFDKQGNITIDCNDIIEKLEELSPKQYACEWDNVGLLVGRRYKSINRIMVALDATIEVVNMACETGCDMLITHHPMIFSPVKTVTDESIEGKKILMLAEHGISYYAMHTNFDTVGSMASAVANEVLKLDCTNPIEQCDLPGEGMGRFAFLPEPMTKDRVCEYIKKCLELPEVMFYGATPNGKKISDDKKFTQIAVMPGSGKSFIDKVIECGCDLYLTGDMGYHEIQYANERGLSIIDATHYGLEKVFANYVAEYLRCSYPLVDIDEINGKPKACRIPEWIILEKVNSEYFNK